MCVSNSNNGETMDPKDGQNTLGTGRNNPNSEDQAGSNSNASDQKITTPAAGEAQLLDKIRRIREIQLDDSMPSEIYRKIKQLAGDSLTDSVVLDLWADRFPEYRPFLKDFPLKVLMEWLDEWKPVNSRNGESINHSSFIVESSAALATNSTVPRPNDATLRSEITELRENFTSFTAEIRLERHLQNKNRKRERKQLFIIIVMIETLLITVFACSLYKNITP